MAQFHPLSKFSRLKISHFVKLLYEKAYILHLLKIPSYYLRVKISSIEQHNLFIVNITHLLIRNELISIDF